MLVDYLRKKFATLRPYPNGFICRVPQPKHCLHPSDYTPKMVSIGPLHHCNEEFSGMEEHRINYLHYFLQRTYVRVADFLTSIKINEANLRNCYAETLELSSDEFVTMILLDALFLMELFLRGFYSDFIKPWTIDQLSADLWC